MNLAECDKRAAQLLRDYQALGIRAHILRPKDGRGNYLIWTEARDMSELSAELEQIAESLFDGSAITVRELKA